MLKTEQQTGSKQQDGVERLADLIRHTMRVEGRELGLSTDDMLRALAIASGSPFDYKQEPITLEVAAPASHRLKRAHELALRLSMGSRVSLYGGRITLLPPDLTPIFAETLVGRDTLQMLSALERWTVVG